MHCVIIFIKYFLFFTVSTASIDDGTRHPTKHFNNNTYMDIATGEAALRRMCIIIHLSPWNLFGLCQTFCFSFCVACFLGFKRAVFIFLISSLFHSLFVRFVARAVVFSTFLITISNTARQKGRREDRTRP